MFITGGAPHRPATLFSASVGVKAACSTGTSWDVDGSVDVMAGSGVHVAGIWNGVTVGICRAGPRGCCHLPAYSQKASPNSAQASTKRKERMAFWGLVISADPRAE